VSSKTRTDPVAVCSQCGRERPCRYARTPAAICGTCRARAYTLPMAVCSGCGRERPCLGARTDTPMCETCRAKQRPKWVPPTRQCVICNRTRPCLHADSDQPICRSCANQHPSRHEQCIHCRQLKRVAARSTAGPECPSCRGRRLLAKVTCQRCQLTARPSAAQPQICEACADERVAQICTECGAQEQNYRAGRCAACSLRAWVTDLTAAGDPLAVTRLSS